MLAPTRSGAVFLSYAHEDVDSARRIAEALRVAEVVVWFDQSELRGGDAWDQKIREQIRDCALFVPIISAHTQARREGYFRREWKQAAERTRDMADGTPFLVPVVVDTTADRAALVPDEFRAVQWTRLPGGETPAGFVQRVQILLRAEATVPTVPGQSASATPLASGRRFPAWATATLAATAAAVCVYLATRMRPKETPAPVVTTKLGAEMKAPAAPRLGPKSIAVLPFENVSEDKAANAFFADGMHEDLITHLLSIHELRCLPRTTVMGFRDSRKPLREIAEEAGVAYLLSGSVRRADNQVRLTATLIGAASGEPVWSKAFNKDISQRGAIFAVQTELAHAIAAELKATLSPQEKLLVERAPTVSIEAYDLYLKAREVRSLKGTGRAALQEQLSLLKRAVEIDPQFGLAWAKVAWAESFMFGMNDGDGARVGRARDALDNAKLLIGETAELFLAQGWYHYLVARDFDRALAQVRNAVQIAPSSAEAHFALAVVQRRQGRGSEAMRAMRDAQRIDPTNAEFHFEAAVTALAGRRYAEAETSCSRAAALGRTGDRIAEFRAILPFLARGEMPNEPLSADLPLGVRRGFDLLRGKPVESGSRWTLDEIFDLSARGKTEEVRTRLRTSLTNLRQELQQEPGSRSAWAWLALMEALSGNRQNSVRCAEKAIEVSKESKEDWFTAGYRLNVAHAYAWAGETAKALEEYARMLNTFYDADSYFRSANVFVMRRHPAFFPLRGDPRFEALLDDPKNNAPLF